MLQLLDRADFHYLQAAILEENVQCEYGVVPFEVPPEREQGLLFCTTLNPLLNGHCLLFSGLSCFVSVQCVKLSAGERNSDVDSAIILCLFEHLSKLLTLQVVKIKSQG